MVSLDPSRRYWLSMAGIVLGTLLVAGLVGGAVAVRLGPGSLVSGTVVVGILLGGWVLGSRVTERKKLDLPLWRALTTAQARELARFREFKRTGRVLEPEDGSAAGSADGPRAADRSSLSRKDRARMADVERRRAEIKKIIQTPEFQERVREDALLEREVELFDELEDLDFLQYGSRATS